MTSFLTAVQLELLFMARPDVSPHPGFEADLEWLARRGLLAAKPDGSYRRTRAGQRRVAAELRAASRGAGSGPRRPGNADGEPADCVHLRGQPS